MNKPFTQIFPNRFFIFILAIISTFLSFTHLSAQENGRPVKVEKNIGWIIGNVLDASSGKAIAFATVQARLMKDSSMKGQQTCDKNGAFELEKLPLGYYFINVKAVGYSSVTIDSIYLRAERSDFNLGDIKLKNNTQQMDEVIVYAEKPLIENKDGKITYNVGESAMSNGSTTSELLKNMPLVSNDPTGKILLKGKEPKILIDDKPTDLNADQLKDLLESLPGSSVEKIELMTNPPPQYAGEQGGVINIITRKGKIGFTGKSSISAGTRGEGSIATNIGYREKTFSSSAILSINGSRLSGYSFSKRQNIYSWGSNYYNTYSDWTNKNLRPSLRAQMSYEWLKKHQIEWVYQGNLNYFNNETNTNFTNLDSSSKLTKQSNRYNGSDGNGFNHSITISYTLKGNNPLKVLRININGNKGKNYNAKDYYQQYLNQDIQPTGDSTQSQYFNNFTKGVSCRINYDYPFMKKNLFSTGSTILYTDNYNNLNTSFFSKQDSVFIPSPALSNDFSFRQTIITARASASVALTETVKFSAGVQYENTQFGFIYFKSVTLGDAPERNYGNWLPNCSIRKDFSKSFNSAIIYRASIRRPGITELNPNIDYSDNINLKSGNVALLPSVADNFDFNCSWMKGKYYVNTSLGYNIVKNVFNQIKTLYDSGRTLTTYQNISNRHEYEAAIWGGYTFHKKLRGNGSAGYTFNQYSTAEKLLYKYQDGSSYYFGLNLSYIPTNVINMEANVRYSSFASPQGKTTSNVNSSFGIQRKYFDKRFIVGIQIIDPFTLQQFTTYTYGSNFTTENFNSSNTRNYRLTLTYQLNKMKGKSTLSEGERRRALERAGQKAKNSEVL